MHPIRLCAMCAIAISSAFSAAAATTYEAVRDYSIKANPTGPWGYLDENGLLTTSTRAYYGIKGLWAWTNGQAFCNTSVVSRNRTGGTVTYSTLVQPTNELRLDPEANAFNTVRFQAPNAGSYNVSGLFRGIDTEQQSHQVSITLNGVSQYTKVIDAYGEVGHFKLALTLSTGDTLDFVVQTGASCFSLSTGLSVKIVGP